MNLFPFKNSSFFIKYRDGFVALGISAILIAIYLVFSTLFYAVIFLIQKERPSLTDSSAKIIVNVIEKATVVVMMEIILCRQPIAVSMVFLLTLITTPLAIYCAARNNRLSVPIRCSTGFNSTTTFIYDLTCDYSLTDIAQYFQFLISLSRFLVVSFNGLYFRYTIRWPLVQLIIPYFLRISIELLLNLIIDQEKYFFAYLIVDRNLTIWPYFVTCGLDYVTNRKMKQLKRCGKASRTETLLMVQMLSNSFMILINFLVAYFLGIFFVTFLGWAMLDILDRLINFNQALLFGLASSTMSILFLRKPRERARTKSTIVNQNASRYRH